MTSHFEKRRGADLAEEFDARAQRNGSEGRTISMNTLWSRMIRGTMALLFVAAFAVGQQAQATTWMVSFDRTQGDTAAATAAKAPSVGYSPLAAAGAIDAAGKWNVFNPDTRSNAGTMSGVNQTYRYGINVFDGTAYDNTAAGAPLFSTDGNKTAYWKVISGGDMWLDRYGVNSSDPDFAKIIGYAGGYKAIGGGDGGTAFTIQLSGLTAGETFTAYMFAWAGGPSGPVNASLNSGESTGSYNNGLYADSALSTGGTLLTGTVQAGGTVTIAATFPGRFMTALVFNTAPFVPKVTLGVSPSAIAEAAGVATVTATLNGAHTQDVTVNLAFSGTATLTDDYTRSGTSITIPAGQTSGTITLTAVQDATPEIPDETIVVDVDTVVNGTENGSQQATATITDDDGDPHVTLGIAGTPMAEALGVATVTATLDKTHTQDVTVNLAFSGTATLTADYTRSGTSIVIPAGQTSGTMTLTAVQDAVYENPNETIIVDISTVQNGLETGTQQVTATIADDDPPPPPTWMVTFDRLNDLTLAQAEAIKPSDNYSPAAAAGAISATGKWNVFNPDTRGGTMLGISAGSQGANYFNGTAYAGDANGVPLYSTDGTTIAKWKVVAGGTMYLNRYAVNPAGTDFGKVIGNGGDYKSIGIDGPHDWTIQLSGLTEGYSFTAYWFGWANTAADTLTLSLNSGQATTTWNNSGNPYADSAASTCGGLVSGIVGAGGIVTLRATSVQGYIGSALVFKSAYIPPPAEKLVVTLPGQTFTSGSGNSGPVDGQAAGSSFNITLSAVLADGVTLAPEYTGTKTVSYSGPGTPAGGTPPTYTTK